MIFGFNKFKEGSREDYLMGAVYWMVATPEELNEWRELQRPAFLKRWDERLQYLQEDLLNRIKSLRQKAIDYRNSASRRIEEALSSAHKYELEADALEARLHSGNYDYSFWLKGY